MSVKLEWPNFGPIIIINVNVTSGTLSLSGTNQLANHGAYSWSPTAEVVAAIYKNGTLLRSLAINTANGNVTISGGNPTVATNDEIEFRFEYTAPESLDWYSRVLIHRTAHFVVPSGNSSFTFNGTTNVQPVPTWDGSVGWDTNNKFKFGITVSNDDGAALDMTCKTRLNDTSPDQESSSTIDLDSSSVQTHVSTFSKNDVTSSFDLTLLLKSSTSTTWQQDKLIVRFTDPNTVPTYPGSPSTSRNLWQTKESGPGLKIDASHA